MLNPRKDRQDQKRALQALANFAASDDRSPDLGVLEERELPSFRDYLADEYPEERNSGVRERAIRLFNLIAE